METNPTRSSQPDSIAETTPVSKQSSQSLPTRFWKNWIQPVGVAILLVVTFRSAVADWNDVPSQSMEPTILVGDRIFVNKLAYDLKVPFTNWHLAEWGGPERGDVVVFFAPGKGEGKRMVKRVVGVPGDSIELRNNHLLINGQQADYTMLGGAAVDASLLTDSAPFQFITEKLGPVSHTMMVQPARPAQRTFTTTKIPPGQYFMMGDNRDNSGDSRVFGLVPRDAIMGKAVGLAFSLDTRRSYAPRWNRFFRGM